MSEALEPSSAPPSGPTWTTELERLQSFGRAVDEIHAKVKAKMGPTDLRYIRKVDVVSRGAELLGRVLVALAPGPLLFAAGVLSLWVYKQLQATEIGHGALHGAYNRFDDAPKYHSKTHNWHVPIDEESWLRGHNGRHHGLTNVAGEDADIHFGPVRLTEQTPHRPIHRFQLPFTLLVLIPNFWFLMNVHFSGLSDVWSGNRSNEGFDFIADRSPEEVRGAYRRAFRKYLPYYAKEFLLWPLVSALVLLSPIVFAKSLLANFLAEKLRNIYSGTTIICGHVGEKTVSFGPGTRPRCKGERYAMQVQATNNFDVPWLVSLFCGALDKQIEHHLFPTMPTNRLREIAPEVRLVCEAHGIEYRQESWPRATLTALREIARLSRPLTEPPATVPTHA